MLDATADGYAGHVVDHVRAGHPVEQLGVLWEILGVEVQHDVPPERLHPIDQPPEHIQLGRSTEMSDEVEARAPHADVVQLGDVGVRERLVDHRHPGVPARAPLERIDHRRVVGPVATRLDEHRPRQTEPPLQLLEQVEAGVGRGVGPVGSEREASRRTEHVTVRIACPGRGRERWRVWHRDRCGNRAFEGHGAPVESGGARSVVAREDGAVHQFAGCAHDARPFDGDDARRVGGGDDGGGERAGRVLAHDDPAIVTEDGDISGGRSGQQCCGCDRYGTEHADCLVAAVRDERPRVDVATVEGRRHHRQLRHRTVGDITEVHEVARLQTDRLQPLSKLCVRLQIGGGFVAGDVHVARSHDDDGHPIVDQSALDTVDHVDDVAGRQQCTARATCDAFEVERDRRRLAGHPVDRRNLRRQDGAEALVVGQTIDHRKRRGGDAVRVDHVDPGTHNVNWFVDRGIDQASFECERPDAGEQVAAVLLIGDGRLIDADLQEQIVDVSIVAVRPSDDRDLAGERMGTTDAVDLARVRRAHRPEQ